ncbi:MAG: hypothetical protein ACREF8_07505 [Chthoniobacterales bacterium]
MTLPSITSMGNFFRYFPLSSDQLLAGLKIERKGDIGCKENAGRDYFASSTRESECCPWRCDRCMVFIVVAIIVAANPREEINAEQAFAQASTKMVAGSAYRVDLPASRNFYQTRHSGRTNYGTQTRFARWVGLGDQNGSDVY